jgi:hypothetical protein
MTFAFGMNDLFKEVYRSGRASLRFAVMEKASGPRRTPEAREEEEEKIRRLRFDEANLFAIGSMLTSARFDRWLEEKLTGLNSHVRYIHNKFMLIDPLSDDPIVIKAQPISRPLRPKTTTRTCSSSGATPEWRTFTSASSCACTAITLSANSRSRVASRIRS